MNSLNILDFVILGLIIGGALWGYKIGCFRSIVPTVLILVIVTIVYIFPVWKEYFAREGIVSFFLVILLLFVGFVVWGFIARFFQSGIGSSVFSNLNKILGLLLGIILGTVLGGFLVFILNKYGGAEAGNVIESSSLGQSILKFFYIIMNFIEKCFPFPPKRPWWKRVF